MIDSLFEEFEKNRDKYGISIRVFRDWIGQYRDKIVLYGAGSAGIAFFYKLKKVGIEPVCFSDGDSKKWGCECEGLKIISPEQISEKVDNDALVVVCINTDGKNYCKSFDEALRKGGHSAVYQRLRDAGCINVIDYTFFRRVFELYEGDIYNLPSCSDVSQMIKHKKEIKSVYDLLSDDKSKCVFLKLLRFRLLDDSVNIPTEPLEKQYFEYGLLPQNDGEIFVDCGAYDGISLKTFLYYNKKFAKYYCIEPDEYNFLKLESYVATLPNDIRKKIDLKKKAVWNMTEKVPFYELKGPGSFVADIGKAIIDAEPIDKLLGGERATFIKMNIEGSEINAIKGARQTIANYSPKLAISGYHKTADIWEVPLLIHRINSDYQLYLRSYMNHLSFIYYGICK